LDERQVVENRIHELKRQLRLAIQNQKNLTHPDVLAISQQLDQSIVEWEKRYGKQDQPEEKQE